MAATTDVIDLSHWNTVEDFDAMKRAGVLGIIHKATEGTYNTDETYKARREPARAVGLKWGAYHFGTDDDVARQVDRFLGVVGDDPDCLLALDFEDYGSNSMSLEQARYFIELVEERTGRSCVLYSGNRIKEQLTTADEWWGSHRLWLAQYANEPKLPPAWDCYWLWQFRQDGRVDGVNGDVDCNHYDGDPDDLLLEWSGSTAAAPEPEPEPHEQFVEIKITVRVTPGVHVTIDPGTPA